MGGTRASDGRIGIVCHEEHEVFSVVAKELRDRGYAVEFLEPGVRLEPSLVDELSVLVNKKIRWESFQALEYAYRTGTPTWTGYVPTRLFTDRLAELVALEAVGFRVPTVHTEPPAGDYVAKEFFDIHDSPVLGGEGDFFEPIVGSSDVDEKYYAVDDGDRVHVSVVRYSSKLYGDRELLGRVDPDPEVEAKIRNLLKFARARALGVDVVPDPDGAFAIDVNPATSYRHTALELQLADSIETTLPREERLR